MKLPTILTLGLTVASLSGCRAMYGTDPYGTGFPRAGDKIRGASLDKALIVQSTLYPYHFVLDAAQLNDLGLRDLNVLAAHFRSSPGTLRVHRGGTPETLYSARLAAVMESLVAGGVNGALMHLQDGLPGGDGLPSERVVVVLERAGTDPMSGTSTTNEAVMTGGSFAE